MYHDYGVSASPRMSITKGKIEKKNETSDIVIVEKLYSSFMKMLQGDLK